MRGDDPTTEFEVLPNGQHRINHCYFNVGDRHWENVLKEVEAEGCDVQSHRHPRPRVSKEGALNFIVTFPEGTTMFTGGQPGHSGSWPINIFLLPNGKCATILHSQEFRTCRTLLFYGSPRELQKVFGLRSNVPEELHALIWGE